MALYFLFFIPCTLFYLAAFVMSAQAKGGWEEA